MTNITAGALAGAATLVMVYPLDWVRTLVATDARHARHRNSNGGAPRYTGLMDACRQTVAEHGIAKGLYRGFGMSLAAIVVYRGLYFGMYDSLAPRILTGRWTANNIVASFFLGWSVTIGAGLASYPLDTIRRMIHVYPPERYTSSWQCMRTIVANEGYGTLFKGGGALILRGISGALVLAGWDHVNRGYTRHQTMLLY